MANIIDYVVDVLAASPQEINRIAERIHEPSKGLLDWVAGRFPQERTELEEGVRSLVAFEPVKNLGYSHDSVNQARRFRNSFTRWTGIVKSHLFEVSEEFPSALFMVLYYDQMASYSGKHVVHGGKLLCEIHDGKHHAQGVDWVLIDIFAPYRSEYELRLPFGSLWSEWVGDVIEAAGGLRSPQVADDKPSAGAPDASNSAR